MNVDISRVTIESIIKDYITKNSPQKEKWNNKINKNSQSEGRYEKEIHRPREKNSQYRQIAEKEFLSRIQTTKKKILQKDK